MNESFQINSENLVSTEKARHLSRKCLLFEAQTTAAYQEVESTKAQLNYTQIEANTAKREAAQANRQLQSTMAQLRCEQRQFTQLRCERQAWTSTEPNERSEHDISGPTQDSTTPGPIDETIVSDEELEEVN